VDIVDAVSKTAIRGGTAVAPGLVLPVTDAVPATVVTPPSGV
jgi:hypothetical protein